MGSLLSKKESPENPPPPPPHAAPVVADAPATSGGSAGDIDSSQAQEASELLLVAAEQPASCSGEETSEPQQQQHDDATPTPASDAVQQQQQQQEAFDVTTFVESQTVSQQQQQQPVITGDVTETVAPEQQEQVDQKEADQPVQPVAAVDNKPEDAGECERIADEEVQRESPLVESTPEHEPAQAAEVTTQDVQPPSQATASDRESSDDQSSTPTVDHQPECPASVPDDVMVSISDLKVDVNSDPTAHCNADEMVSIGFSDEHEPEAAPTTASSDDVDVPPPVVGEPPLESEDQREDRDVDQNHEDPVEELVKQTDGMNLEEMASTSDEIVQP